MFPPWFIKEMSLLIRTKKYHFKKIKSNSGDTYYHKQKLRETRKTLKQLIRRQKYPYIKDIEQNIYTDPSSF